MFFDEPTTGLDPIMADVINDLIVDCVREARRDGGVDHPRHGERPQDRRPHRDAAPGADRLAGPDRRDRPHRQPYVDQFVNGRAEGRSRWKCAPHDLDAMPGEVRRVPSTLPAPRVPAFRPKRRVRGLSAAGKADGRSRLPASNAAPFSQMGRALRGLRRLEQHGRGTAARRRRRPRQGRPRRRARSISSPDAGRHAAAAPPDRHRRARPGMRRRAGAGLDDAGRRRPRHRQVDPVAAGRRRARRRRPRPPTSPARRRSTRCGCAPSGWGSPTRRCGLAAASSVRDIIAALDDGGAPDLVVIDSIQTMFSTPSTARPARSARCAAPRRS